MLLRMRRLKTTRFLLMGFIGAGCALMLLACTATPGADGMLSQGADAAVQAMTARQTAEAAQIQLNAARSLEQEASARATALKQETKDLLELAKAQQELAAANARETAHWDNATAVMRGNNIATASARSTEIAESKATIQTAETAEHNASATRFWDGETATLTAKLNAEGTQTAVPKTATTEAIAMLRAEQDAKDEAARREQARAWEGFKAAAWAMGGALLPIAVFIVLLALVVLGGYWLYLKIRNGDLKERTLRDKQEIPIGMLMPPVGLPFRPNRQPATIRLIAPPREYVEPAPKAAEDIAEGEYREPDSSTELPSHALAARPLDVRMQPTGLHIPLGDTGHVAKDWVSLVESPHLIVGGATGMRKSTQVHGFIQALIYGGACELYLHDGKQGSEFSGYVGAAGVEFVPDDAIFEVLRKIRVEMDKRFVLGMMDLDGWNKMRQPHERLKHIVIVIDEMFDVLLELEGAELLGLFSRKGRAAGIHLILATQLPDGESVPRQLRANALMRIAFTVFNAADSKTILSQTGAEKLPPATGRMLVWFGGRMFEAQQFEIQKPAPKAMPKAPTMPYEDMEIEMLRLALANDGWFVVTKIAGELKIDDSVVTRFGRRLQRDGLLTKVQRDAHGQPVGRKMNDALIAQIRQLRQIATSPKSLVEMAA